MGAPAHRGGAAEGSLAMASAHENERRNPPAYQEYAADLLADRGFRSMSAAERGVLFSMRLECWCNRSVPADPASLARVLGLEASEVKDGLTERVLRYFEAQEGAECVLVCPQLDAYRTRLDERHAKMSEGGRRGADHTNQSRRDRIGSRGLGHPDALPDGHPAHDGGGHPGGLLSRAEQSRAKQNRTASIGRSNEHADFIAALEGPALFEAGARSGRATARFPQG